MTLEDITKEEKYKIGEVSSDRKSVSFSDGWWEAMALHHPHMFVWMPEQMKEEEIKVLISHLDKVILEEISATNVSEQQKEEAREARKELLKAL